MLTRSINATEKGRRARTGAVLIAACALALALAMPGSALAAPYGWDGGHDSLGASQPSGTVYFAEGTTRNGFEEFILMRNTGPDTSLVTLNYLFGSSAPQAQEVRIAAWSGASICVNDVVGPGRDVSVAIAATPGIIAERQVFFNYKGVWTGGSVTAGVEQAQKTWYFAEGTTRKGFQEWLCVQNPTPQAVMAKVTYMFATGETLDKDLALGANSRVTVDVNAEVGPEKDVSVKVAAPQPIVAERPMYFDYKSTWRGGHTATGASVPAGEWYFAEGTTRSGFEEWLCMMNPGADTTARVEFLFNGAEPLVKEYPLKAHSRTTVDVNAEVGPEKDVSIKVTTPGEVLCERPMYFKYHGKWEGGHDVVGSTAGARTWYFPTASSGPGFESWLCVANPGALKNKMVLEVFGDGGDYNSSELEMAPRSRATFDLNTLAANVRAPWLKVSGTQELVAERPTYFSYTPKVEPQPFTIATWAGVEIKSPIRYSDLLGPQFHEASNDNASPPMQPVGMCLGNYNAARMAPGIGVTGNDPGYFIEETRSRGTYATTACDVQAKAGTTVYAPVNGTVVCAESYLLYGSYPDLRVRIVIDGHPEYQMAVLHMSKLLVSVGQRVEAGKSPIGVVRDLVPYFNSGPNPFTRDDGNHPHIQINYSPPEAGSRPESG
jgi:hypothetical protein